MKVLMFGWEFPPHSSGGLGTACYGLTKGLSNQNIEVTFILPKANSMPEKTHVKLVVADNHNKAKELKDMKRITDINNITNINGIKIRNVNSLLVPYADSGAYKKRYSSYQQCYHQYCRGKKGIENSIYSQDLYEEVQRYALLAKEIAKEEPHDIIHCHDWMTYAAGIEARKVSGKPLVIHVHATEFDRTAGNPNQFIYDLEKQGMEEADHIMAVSQFTKNKIVKNYGISSDKISVVHNAVEFKERKSYPKIRDNEKIVLFLGRITIQKGPDYFLAAAKKVLEKKQNVKFIVAGSGDMEGFMIEKAAEMGIGDKVLFTGFLQGDDVDRIYSMADLYVMPSVSEPFGITPLEAMRNNTPVLISRQSGVSEVISHALKVDFWDVDNMANKILGVLNYKAVHNCLKENGAKEVLQFDWNIPASKCIDVYEKTVKEAFNAVNMGV